MEPIGCLQTKQQGGLVLTLCSLSWSLVALFRGTGGDTRRERACDDYGKPEVESE